MKWWTAIEYIVKWFVAFYPINARIHKRHKHTHWGNLDRDTTILLHFSNAFVCNSDSCFLNFVRGANVNYK